MVDQYFTKIYLRIQFTAIIKYYYDHYFIYIAFLIKRLSTAQMTVTIVYLGVENPAFPNSLYKLW